MGMFMLKLSEPKKSGVTNEEAQRFVNWRGKQYPTGEISFTRQKRFVLSWKNRSPRSEGEERSLSLVRVCGLFTAIWIITHERISYRQLSLDTQSVGTPLEFTELSISEKKQ